MKHIVLENSKFFNPVGVTLERVLGWHKQVTVLSVSAAKKLEFLYVSEEKLNIEYTHMGSCSLDYAPASGYCSEESTLPHLIGDSFFSSKFASLVLRKLNTSLPIFPWPFYARSLPFNSTSGFEAFTVKMLVINKE